MRPWSRRYRNVCEAFMQHFSHTSSLYIHHVVDLPWSVLAFLIVHPDDALDLHQFLFSEQDLVFHWKIFNMVKRQPYFEVNHRI